MKRLFVVVAVVVLLGGCNAFGGGGSDAPETTVSPAPVPSPDSPITPTSTPGACLVPPPATPADATEATPAEPVALPGNDTISGHALVDQHSRQLAAHRFHLRLGNRSAVWSMPNASSFTYEGIGFGIRSTEVYAAGGTLYMVDRRGDTLRVVQRPYRVGSERNERYVRRLTGRNWLQETIGWYNYTVTGTRTWNGNEVRVLRDVLDQEFLASVDGPSPGLVEINSTLYVDRRGIIRHVRHVRDTRYEVRPGEYMNETDLLRFAVDEVGTARLHRPDGFCVRNPDAATVATPEPLPEGSGERVPSTAIETDSENVTRPATGTGSGTEPTNGTQPPSTRERTATTTPTEGT